MGEIKGKTLGKIKQIESLKIDDYIELSIQDKDFKDFNIIYGLNGSGKTSLSRLIYDFSENRYNGSENNNVRKGQLNCEDGSVKDNLEDHGKFKNIFVFNYDFIDANITEGIKHPYKNMSEINYMSEINFGSKIQEINKDIENLEDRKKRLEEDNTNENKKKEKIINEFQTILSNSGLPPTQFKAPKAYKYIESYNKNNEDLLTEEQLKQIEKESKELNAKDSQEEQKEIDEESTLIHRCDGILGELETLLNHDQIASSEEIEKFNTNTILKGYVKNIFYDILEKNKEYNNQCPLCDTDTIFINGNKKSSFEDFYKNTLKNYFNEAKKKFDEKCQKIQDNINLLTKLDTSENNIRHGDYLLSEDKYKYIDYRTNLLTFYPYIKNEFCQSMKNLINNKQNNIDTSNNNYQNDIDKLRKIFNQQKEKYCSNLHNMNTIIKKYNTTIKNRKNELDKKHTKLKNHYCFKHQENYLNILNNIKKNNSDINNTTEEIEKKKKERIKEQNIFKNKYLAKINKDLKDNTSLGIQLETDNNDSVILCRGDKKNIKLKNLSEGEKNILLLIYFIHLVEDYKANNDDVIVVLDDPHSSLDDRNSYNLIKLIKIYFIKKGYVMQFFLFTHNTNFLKKLNNDLLQSSDIKKELLKKETFEIEKYSSNNQLKIKIKQTYNRWQNMTVEYVNAYLEYHNIYHDKEECDSFKSSKSPREFLEEMQTYLYPSFNKINVTEILKKINVTINIHETEHFNKMDYSEKKDNIKTFYQNLQSVEYAYIKEHIKLLEDAIKTYITNKN